ncbi:hypothetical protein E2553_42080 [Paraburkholderia dipogonis]|uniref:Uncharacterized protein n=1 Tax=Paraburkholderia dipogonis TaxID=1211383 RepID=A0A4Y8MI54_9BURK|nr:hypothetical protein [Paraburkholderia dipogonis]TFE37129.1 hypothetical protein E2553_42080 [Paraburkholderia dipogonis]
MTEVFVIAQARTAGCVLAERSETNANALDTKDSPHGGSSLTLTYAGGDADRSRYAAIREAGRRTVRFVKSRRVLTSPVSGGSGNCGQSCLSAETLRNYRLASSVRVDERYDVGQNRRDRILRRRKRLDDRIVTVTLIFFFSSTTS